MKTRFLLVVALSLCLLATNLGTVVAQAPDSGAAPQSPSQAQTLTPAEIAWLPWHVSTIASKNDVGAYSSIAFDPGTGIPYISYYDATTKQLKLASPAQPVSKGNCGPNSAWWCRIVETTKNVGRYSSIAIFRNGFSWYLGIAYVNDNNHGLRYAEYDCLTLLHCGYWTYWDIYNQSNVSVTSPSLKIGTDEVPQISFHVLYNNVDYLYYAKWVAGGGNCTDTAWECDDLFSGGGVYNSLALTSTNSAAIAFYDVTNTNLMIATQLNPSQGFTKNCGPNNNTWYCYSIDPYTDVKGLFPSMVFLNDVPYIAYYDKTSGELKLAHWVGNLGNGNCAMSGITTAYEWKCDNFDDIGEGLIGNIGISLGLDAEQNLVLAYMKFSDPITQLVVARQAAAFYPPHSIMHYGNCGIRTAGKFFFYLWVCQTLDGGSNQYLNEAFFASVAVSPAGLVYIAYSEYDSGYDKNSLKLAYQQFQTFMPGIKK